MGRRWEMQGMGKNANFSKKLLAFEDPVSIVSPLDFLSGVVAQLEERHNGIVEVRGSRPLGSTTFRNGIRKGAVFVFRDWAGFDGSEGVNHSQFLGF